MSFVSVLTRRFRSLGRNSSDNVTVLCALSILPMMVGVGAAVDFGSASPFKTAMQKAAEASSLAARRRRRLV